MSRPSQGGDVGRRTSAWDVGIAPGEPQAPPTSYSTVPRRANSYAALPLKQRPTRDRCSGRRYRDAVPGRARARVLVTRRLPPGGLDPLADGGHEVIQRPDDEPFTHGELVRAASDADAIISVLTDRIDRAVIAGAPKLRVVANEIGRASCRE